MRLPKFISDIYKSLMYEPELQFTEEEIEELVEERRSGEDELLLIATPVCCI